MNILNDDFTRDDIEKLIIDGLGGVRYAFELMRDNTIEDREMKLACVIKLFRLMSEIERCAMKINEGADA